jgi:hypothetical protein
MDVLGSHRCDFHFDVPRIDLDQAEPSAAAWYPLATAPHCTPAVQLQWDQASVQAMWDTVAGATLVDQSWASRHPDIVTVHSETGEGMDVTGARASYRWGTMAPCRAGGAGFAEQACAVIDFSVLNAALDFPWEVVVGLPFITQASWCMDFPGRRWTLRP